MIRIPTEVGTRLHLFLSPLEAEFLEDITVTEDYWKPGRREGGYFKLNIKELVEQSSFDDDLLPLAEVSERALDELRRFTGVNELDGKWDAYLLFYPPGSEVVGHKDPAPEGMRHVRLNVIVRPAEDGGELVVEPGDMSGTWHFFSAETVGEGVIFSPSTYRHKVREIAGSRVVLSFGCLVPA